MFENGQTVPKARRSSISRTIETAQPTTPLRPCTIIQARKDAIAAIIRSARPDCRMARRRRSRRSFIEVARIEVRIPRSPANQGKLDAHRQGQCRVYQRAWRKTGQK